MSSDPVVSLVNVRKEYRIYCRRRDRLAELLFGSTHHRKFTALKNIDLVLRKGQMLGVLGRNGAGKSSLVHIIAGTSTPTGGTVSRNSQPTVLSELGGSFNPSLSGRENVYHYAKFLGMQEKDILARMDDIIRFADIGAFIDEPVQTYSAGMRMRVAFAGAFHLDSDLYLLDEVFAVGDAAFQRKCLARMSQLMDSARKTFVIVTHSPETVSSFCTRVIVLNKGEILFDGEPKEGADFYRRLLFANGQSGLIPDDGSALTCETRHGTGEMAVESLEITDESDVRAPAIRTGSKFSLRFRVRAKDDVEHPHYFIRLQTKTGVTVYSTGTSLGRSERTVSSRLGREETRNIEFRMTANLIAGDYFFTVTVGTLGIDGSLRVMDARVDALRLTVTGPKGYHGIANLDALITDLGAEVR